MDDVKVGDLLWWRSTDWCHYLVIDKCNDYFYLLYIKSSGEGSVINTKYITQYFRREK